MALLYNNELIRGYAFEKIYYNSTIYSQSFFLQSLS